MDSNTQHVADFRTPQAANDSPAVQNNDTLLIASTTDAQVFPVLTLTKKLKVVGTGWWLKENFGAPMIGAKITTINFGTGSSGSTIESLWFGSAGLLDAITDVTIFRCHFDSIIDSNRWTDGWIVRNSFGGSMSFNNHAQAGHIGLYGNIFSGGLLIGGTGWTYGSATASRNTFWVGSNFGKTLFQNNMCNGGNYFFFNGTVCNNNILSSGSYYYNQDGSNILSNNYTWPTNWHSGATQYQEDPYRLTNSITVQVMNGTTQMGPPSNWGAFSAGGDYVVSGIPTVPVVIGLEAPPVIRQGEPLPVTVTVKSQP